MTKPNLFPFIRPSVPEDAERMAPKLRQFDIQEIQQITPSADPLRALRSSLQQSSDCWTVELNGEPAIMCGVSDGPPDSGTGMPWMLATDKLADCATPAILKEFGARMSSCLTTYGRLANTMVADDPLRIDWLKRVGFDFPPDREHQYNGRTFIYFQKVA